jgi:hypothetical protein
MADDKLTDFLVALCTEAEVYESFAKNDDSRKEVVGRERFGLTQGVKDAILEPFTESLRQMIGTQQGGGKSRALEANQLATRANELAKLATDVFGESAALAKALAVRLEAPKGD